MTTLPAWQHQNIAKRYWKNALKALFGSVKMKKTISAAAPVFMVESIPSISFLATLFETSAGSIAEQSVSQRSDIYLDSYLVCLERTKLASMFLE